MLGHGPVKGVLLTGVVGRLALLRHVAPNAKQLRIGRRPEG
jgi:hypothetical protein